MPVGTDRLTDPQAVAAGIGQQELPHTVRGVAERAQPGQALGRHPPVGGPQALLERGVQCVHVVGADQAGAVAGTRVVLLHAEEVQLDAAALDDCVGLGSSLMDRHFEAERGVEIEHRRECLTGQDRDRRFDHAR